jgi:hypothetical protein
MGACDDRDAPSEIPREQRDEAVVRLMAAGRFAHKHRHMCRLSQSRG